ncbi:hypothetical protein GA830_02410 [Mesorhizobium sp. NBSH29]|uniref:PRC-barrel domain-containing protein n=1 Tax=Mesorhizobium sp. NBSH29 TaxID=2654249 RepID=UPI001896454E|nr:PRC-barrel domain-containing protein [Mesorhizobium sp. NBSH29]QPC85711.1 hypothetical protein GA830_02410 [Mesorhizobium sp. NBSH29]
MFRTLLTTTALATFIAGSALAQTSTTAPADTTAPAATEQAPVVKADGFLATQIIGETVYNGTGDNAENIGDVNDIVLGMDGKATSIIIGVGGFLGIGEKNVEIAYDQLEWAEKDGDRWIVIASSKEELEAQPAFDRRGYDMVPAAMETGTSTAPAPADATAPAPADTTAPAPADTTAPVDPNAAPAEEPKPAN